jgi:hypothetical protein
MIRPATTRAPTAVPTEAQGSGPSAGRGAPRRCLYIGADPSRGLRQPAAARVGARIITVVGRSFEPSKGHPFAASGALRGSMGDLRSTGLPGRDTGNYQPPYR